MSMQGQVQNSMGKLAGLRAQRREQMVSMFPDSTRRHRRHVISPYHLNRPRYHMDNHHGNSSDDNRTESRKNQPLFDVPSEDGARPMVVDNDSHDTGSERSSFSHFYSSLKQQLRDWLAYLFPLSGSTSNTQGQSDEHQARKIQSAEYQAGSATLKQALPVPVMADTKPHHVALPNPTERLGQVKPKGLTKADKQQPEHRDGTRTDTCHRDVHSESQKNSHQHFDSRNRDRSRSKLVAGIPPMITRPEIRKVSTREFKKVVIDLETSGFGNDAEICQIAATDGLDEFNVYVFPQHGISPGASKVNNLRIEGRVLFQGNCRVSAIHLNEAVSELLKWLESKTPCVLVAHNAKCFDAKHLFKAIVSCNASKEFSKKVLGFSDTLNAFKEYSPERKSFSQPCLAKDLLGTTYNAHNALDDVRVLHQLVSKFLSDEILWRHSFTLSWFKEYTSFLKQKAGNLKSLQPLIRSGTISQGIADKAAASGLVFGHMMRAFQNGGVDGLRSVLTETFHGKPRVTNNEKLLTQINHFFLKICSEKRLNSELTKHS